MLWTANTERYCDVEEGLNDTAEHLLDSIRSNKHEVSPSTIFAVASVREGVRIHTHNVPPLCCHQYIKILTCVCVCDGSGMFVGRD